MNEIVSRQPYADYAAIDATNISRLKWIKVSPQHYQHYLRHQRDSDALTLGSASHTMTLEPERFTRSYAVWIRRTDSGRLAPRSGQHWDQFVVDNQGKNVLTEDGAESASAIARAVRSDPLAMTYLENGDPEVSMYWDRLGRPCKGRVDWMPLLQGKRPTLVGLKTARDCRHYQFAAQAARLSYHMHWAFYFDGFKALTGERPEVIEIVVESKAPHAVAVYKMSDDVLAQGRDDYKRLIELLEDCEQNDAWPGPGGGILQELSLPTWAYAQTSDDIAELDLVED